MSAYGFGSAPKKPTAINTAAAQRLALEEKLGKIGQTLQRDFRTPEEIAEAIRTANANAPMPMEEPELEAIIETHTKGYEPHLFRVPMDGFMASAYPAPGFVVEWLIPRDEVTLLGGHGGSGKSVLALAIAAHVATGKEWAGHKVEKACAVFVSLEDSADHVMHRLQKIMRTFQLDARTVERNLQVIEGTRDPEMMVDRNDFGNHALMPTQTLREVEHAAKGAGLIVIDNASDAYGGNENARREVRAFIRELGRIAKANGAGLVLLAHIDKQAARNGGNNNNYSGSTAWHNSTRSRLALVEEDGQLALRHEKHNRSQRADPVTLHWTDDGVLVPRAGDHEQGSQAARDADAALLAMRAGENEGIRVPVAASGTATSWHALEHLPEMEAFAGKSGKRRFHTTLVALRADGLIAKATYRNEQRKQREVWELTAKGREAAGRTLI